MGGSFLQPPVVQVNTKRTAVQLQLPLRPAWDTTWLLSEKAAPLKRSTPKVHNRGNLLSSTASYLSNYVHSHATVIFYLLELEREEGECLVEVGAGYRPRPQPSQLCQETQPRGWTGNPGSGRASGLCRSRSGLADKLLT